MVDMRGLFGNLNNTLNNLPLSGNLGLLTTGVGLLEGQPIGQAVRSGLQTFQGLQSIDEERKRKALVQDLVSKGGFTEREKALIAATPIREQPALIQQINARKAAASKPNAFQQRQIIGAEQGLTGEALRTFVLTGELPKEPKLTAFGEKRAALKDAGIALDSEKGLEALFGIKPTQISGFAEKKEALLEVYEENSPEYLEALFNIKDTPPTVFDQKVAQLKKDKVEVGSDTWNEALYGVKPNFGTTFRRDYNFLKEKMPDASVEDIIGVLKNDTNFRFGRDFERQGDFIVTADSETGMPIFTPIPGSPTDLKQQAAKQKEKKTISAQQAKTDTNISTGLLVLEEIDRAIAAIKANPLLTTGVGAQLTKDIFGTPAANVQELIAPIQANIGFDRLDRMRKESPTGGALGQVAVKELDFLQATRGSLSQKQNAEQLLANLERIGKDYKLHLQRLYQAALKDQQDGVINTVTNEIIDPLDYFSQSEIDMLTSSEAQPQGSFAERLSKATNVDELQKLSESPGLTNDQLGEILDKLNQLSPPASSN